MNAAETHRVALKWAGELLESVMADVTPEQAHWHPPGTANPIAALYAHAVCGLDVVLNGVLLGRQPPLYATSWAGKTGISEPEWQMTPEWARSVQVDFESARAYAQAVYSALDSYLAGCSEQDLEQEHDLSPIGLDIRTVDWVLSAIGTGHVNNMTGEISCLKGIQGGKGYPF